jgi:acyl-coenzyme A thioesterase PaaI-like protein
LSIAAGQSDSVVVVDAECAPAAAPPAPLGRKRRQGFVGWLESSISRLSTRNNFWHRVCSLIWLPYAFKSGIQMKRLDAKTFTAVLPFRRFNRNWYNAMAGASLLANSEIAGGMYLFAEVGGEYTVVCKELRYQFLRPCLGPAVYKVNPVQDLKSLIDTHAEFNIELALDVLQQRLPVPGRKQAARDMRVGRCTAVFHVTPKSQHEAKEKRKAAEVGGSS